MYDLTSLVKPFHLIFGGVIFSFFLNELFTWDKLRKESICHPLVIVLLFYGPYYFLADNNSFLRYQTYKN